MLNHNVQPAAFSDTTNDQASRLASTLQGRIDAGEKPLSPQQKLAQQNALKANNGNGYSSSVAAPVSGFNGRRYLAGGRTGMTADEYTTADRQEASALLDSIPAKANRWGLPLSSLDKQAQQEALKRSGGGF